jgi:hypothetical protein
MSINEIKKTNERKQVEKSDNKLTESLFSNNPHVIDNSPSIKIEKLGKNKFISIINEKKIKPVIKPIISEKKKITGYDLNDFDYDCDFEF